jgi:hypothetical protein
MTMTLSARDPAQRFAIGHRYSVRTTPNQRET